MGTGTGTPRRQSKQGYHAAPALIAVNSRRRKSVVLDGDKVEKARAAWLQRQPPAHQSKKAFAVELVAHLKQDFPNVRRTSSAYYRAAQGKPIEKKYARSLAGFFGVDLSLLLRPVGRDERIRACLAELVTATLDAFQDRQHGGFVFSVCTGPEPGGTHHNSAKYIEDISLLALSLIEVSDYLPARVSKQAREAALGSLDLVRQHMRLPNGLFFRSVNPDWSITRRERIIESEDIALYVMAETAAGLKLALDERLRFAIDAHRALRAHFWNAERLCFNHQALHDPVSDDLVFSGKPGWANAFLLLSTTRLMPALAHLPPSEWMDLRKTANHIIEYFRYPGAGKDYRSRLEVASGNGLFVNSIYLASMISASQALDETQLTLDFDGGCLEVLPRLTQAEDLVHGGLHNVIPGGAQLQSGKNVVSMSSAAYALYTWVAEIAKGTPEDPRLQLANRVVENILAKGFHSAGITKRLVDANWAPRDALCLLRSQAWLMRALGAYLRANRADGATP
jgi:hypothetical protein